MLVSTETHMTDRRNAVVGWLSEAWRSVPVWTDQWAECIQLWILTWRHTHTLRRCRGSECVFLLRQRVQHLVEQLQRSVQVNLQPAGGVFDALPWVITPPTFNEAETHDTQPAQVVHPQTCSWAHTCPIHINNTGQGKSRLLFWNLTSRSYLILNMDLD